MKNCKVVYNKKIRILLLTLLNAFIYWLQIHKQIVYLFLDTCSIDISIGSRNTIHWTDSVKGGVVNEPFVLHYLLAY